MTDASDDTRPGPVERSNLAVVVLGAGFGGLCMGIKLLQAGIRDFLILEKESEVGGTWRDNTYPGAACDVQSHLYSYSFEGKPDWTRRYPGWQEIQRYILDTTDKYQLRPYIRFGREVCAAHFDPESASWTVRTRCGETFVARHFVLASGPLSRPQMPSIPGLERFQGEVFHSARWNHGYELEGKRVASIGTGGSAIQY
jgi:cation diffusion facilitator CzcD-associated flavoprotein CzcO